MVKDNNTILHYAAKYGNDGLARAACKKGCPIDINQKTKPGDHTGLHLATMYRQINVMSILIEYGAKTEEADVNGNTPRDYATDRDSTSVFEDWEYMRNRKRKTSDSE